MNVSLTFVNYIIIKIFILFTKAKLFSKPNLIDIKYTLIYVKLIFDKNYFHRFVNV